MNMRRSEEQYPRDAKIDWRNWRIAGFAAVIAIVALALRLDGLLSASLDGRELFNRRVVAGPSEHMFAAVHHDLLYYGILKASAALANLGPVGLRLPSLVFGLSAVLLTYFVGRKVLGRPWLGLFAAGLVAISFEHVTKSQTARSYTMYAAFVLGYMLLLWHMLERPESRRAWVGLTLASVALTLTHVTGWFYIAAGFPAVALASNRRAVRLWIGSVLTTEVIFVIWAMLVAPPYVAALSTGPSARLTVRSVPHEVLVTYAHLGGVLDFRHGTILILAVSAALFGAVGAYAWRLLVGRLPRPGESDLSGLDRGPDELTGIVLVAGMALAPPLLLATLAALPLGVGWAFHHIFPSQAPWLLVAALGVATLFRTPRLTSRLLAVAAGLTLLLGQFLPVVEKLPCDRKVPFFAIADYLQTHAGPAPRVFTTSWYLVGAPVNFYLGAAGVRTDSVSQLTPAEARSLDTPDYWLLYVADSGADTSLIEDALRSGWRQEKEVAFSRAGIDKLGVRLVHLRRPGADK